MKTFNPNKTVSATNTGIIVCYTDTCKYERVYYKKSPLTELQTSAKSSSYQMSHNINSVQQKLYRECLYGLAVYTSAEVAKMSFMQKRQIIANQQKTQSLLNKLKQKIVHHKIGSFLTTLFHKSTIAKALAHYDDDLEETDKNTMSFKDLGITKEVIINELLAAKLLPDNFYQLK